MDTITHALVGAALSSGKLRDKVGPLAVPAFVTGAVFPDSDIILRAVSSEFYVLEHRGATHSLILWPLWVLVLSSLFYFFKKEKFNKYIPAVIAIGILSHLYMDLVTSWGIMLLYPFSRHRFAWDQMFIIDLYYSGVFILLLVMIWKNFRNNRVLWSKLALVFFIFYHAFTTFNYFGAKRIIKEEMSKEGVSTDKLQIFPGIANPFLWVGATSVGNDYLVSRVNIFTDNREPNETLVSNKGEPWAMRALEQPKASQLLKMARLPGLTKTKIGDSSEEINFYDLQYALRRVPFGEARVKVPMRLQQLYENGKLVSEQFR